ncbi:hypothetical protein TRFO_09723 [Tritrichomonas foetus]|uniref:Regulator of chromosome condensation n=1 Tax=Tritrichomonas foetus TaxID=1144522 RepID=A0A1J4JCA3_9EUKA|nr:hypothetical protein TRFO_09723 [Tritrichomonas foetus]|eukprot:OHS96834.1 hypothetical protein TRFO_09723 [Tritrichomonas foetus]
MAKLFVNGRNDNYQLTDVKCDIEQYGLPIVQVPKYIKNTPKKLVCVSTGCGHSIFINEKGKIFGVGDDQNCQLGTSKREIYKDIIEIKMSQKEKVTWAACGYDYTIFVTENGQLIFNGKGKSEITISLPKKAVFVAAGSDAPCAIDRVGDIHLFSKNIEDKPKSFHLPNPVFDIARSNFFTLAVTIDGKCYGNGEFNNRKDDFVEIESLKGIKVSHVYAFSRNACAVAADGRVFMRGPGSFGELGNGELNDSNEFVQCSITQNVKSAALGQSFALFITKKGTVFGCGKNSLASLMLGTNQGNISIPAESKHITEKASFACCGNYHSFVITESQIVHPGVSFFNVKLNAKKEASVEPTISNLFKFLDFTPE